MGQISRRNMNGALVVPILLCWIIMYGVVYWLLYQELWLDNWADMQLSAQQLPVYP